MKIVFEPDDGDKGDCGSLILSSENHAEHLQLFKLNSDIPRNLVRLTKDDGDNYTLSVALKS